MPFRDSLAMRLRSAYLSLHRAVHALFSPFGITADQFVVLSLLAEEDGIIQRELVRRTWSDANTITALLRLLENKGLIRRAPHDSDGRARCVYLTAEGRTLQETLAVASQALHRRLQQSVPAESFQDLSDCLLGIADTMSSPPPTEDHQ